MAFMGAALIYACGSESDEQFSGNFLEISLSCPDLEKAAEQSRALGIEKDFSDIVELEVTVSNGNPPMVPISDTFEVDEPIVIDIPIGTDRLIEVVGKDILGNVVCRGFVVTDITEDIVEVDLTCTIIFEDCTDGIDNDEDNLIDCEDPECEDFCMEPGDDDDDVPPGNDDDDETPTGPEICDDGIDNDGDTFVDCVDQDCGRFVLCLNPTPPPPSGGGCNCEEDFEDEDCICFCCPECCQGCEPYCDEFLEVPSFCSSPQ